MNKTLLATLVAAITAGVALGVNYTKQQHVQMSSSLIDSTPIGATTPSTGNFTNLNTAHLTLGGGAPASNVLLGNGTEFIPTPMTSVIVTATQQGCLFSSWGNLNSCGFQFNWNPPGFSDSNYTVLGCIANTGNSASVVISMDQSPQPSGFQVTQTMIMSNGAPSGWRPQITCSAIHN